MKRIFGRKKSTKVRGWQDENDDYKPKVPPPIYAYSNKSSSIDLARDNERPPVFTPIPVEPPSPPSPPSENLNNRFANLRNIDLPVRQVSASRSESTHRIIVGVDYGTTYTGVSYIDSSSRSTTKDVHNIRTFPGPGRDADAVWKTPSRIAYSNENKDCTTNQFGFQVKPNMTSYSWTKLLLDAGSRRTEFDDPSLKRSEGHGLMRLPSGKTAVEVVTDYLKELYQWIVSYLEKRISPEVLAVTPMEFWFSHPAIWSDRAKSDTRDAAMAAGFGSRPKDDIYLIPEPEAAGVATLKEYSAEGVTAGIFAGDGILICDCGGGTVDITSYSIKQVYPRLEFEELVEGIGGKCGSTYIDREFHKWMSNNFGAQYDQLRAEKTGPGSRFMKDFEQHKHDFGSSKNLDDPYEVNLVMHGAGSSQFYDPDESVVKLNGHIMLQFFQPVVAKILDLLRSQVSKAEKLHGSGCINRIVLVGGFGDSWFLNNRVREWCQRRNIQLTCPEHPQAAIAKGAALRGLDTVAPIKRRSRHYYGFKLGQVFREGIDRDADSYVDVWSGRKMCRTRMTWEIAKGQIIDEKTKIDNSVEYTYTKGNSMLQTEDLYKCSSDRPPEYSTDPAVEKVATLKHTAREADLENFETMMRDGKQIWKAAYDRSIFMGRKEGTLGYRVHHGGIELGSSEIKYDSTHA